MEWMKVRKDIEKTNSDAEITRLVVIKPYRLVYSSLFTGVACETNLVQDDLLQKIEQMTKLRAERLS